MGRLARRSWSSALVALFCLWGCATLPPPPRDENVLAPDLTVRRIAPGVWLHVTNYDSHGGIPSNGLLVESDSTVVLIDTGWSDSTARGLISFAENRLGKRVSHAVVTHSHLDRSGGLGTLLERRIPVLMHGETKRSLSSTDGMRGVRTFQSDTALVVSNRRIELFYPGAGHSRENIAVWLPREKLLFGGCFLKSLEASTLGNTADADVSAWPQSLQKLRARFPNPIIVVPGHGDVAGKGILQHTAELLASPATARK